MNKIDQIQNLLEEASKLDSIGNYKQANNITNILVKLAQTPAPDAAETASGPQPAAQDAKFERGQDGKHKLILKNGKQIDVPEHLTPTVTLDKKVFNLGYNSENGRFLYVRDDGGKSYTLTDENKSPETRKKKIDLWGGIGGRRLFGDLKLPNLNKIIPLEPAVRKSVINLSHIVRPAGDAVKPVVRQVTDPLSAAGRAIGIDAPGSLSNEQNDLNNSIGKGADRSTSTTSVPSTAEVPAVSPEVTAEPTVTSVVLENHGKKLENIKTSNDLLFWCMSTSLRIPFGQYLREKEKEYYSRNNYNTILAMIDKLVTSPYIKNKYPLIEKLGPGAKQVLDRKTAEAEKTTAPTPSTTSANINVKKQVIASLNEICNELEVMSLHKEAHELTNIMKKIAERGDRATVQIQSDGKPVVIITRANGDFERRMGPKINGGVEYFKNLQHAINYAKRIDPNAEVPQSRPRRVGPTGKPWTRDDQEMFDFESSREDKY